MLQHPTDIVSRRWRWLLVVAGLAGAITACRLRYETVDLEIGSGAQGGVGAQAGDGATGGTGAQGGATNGGEGAEPGSAGDAADPGGSGGSPRGGSSMGGTGEGGSAVGGEAGSAGSTAGSAGSGGSGGSSGSAGSGGTGGTPAGDLVVTTNADENDAGATAAAPGGTGLSLREAITIANATSGAQTITFDSGIVVALTNTLPTVTEAVTISGGVVTGAGTPNGRDCLVIDAGPTTVEGLEVYNCKGRPIHVTGGNDVHIRSCNVHENSGPLLIEDTAGTGTIIGPGTTVALSGGHCLAIENDQTLVIDSRVHDCASVAVFVAGTAANTRIIGNVIVRGNFGISMGSGAAGTVLWHNTIGYNAASGLNVGQASPNDLRNNIFVLNAIYGVAAADARFSQNDYNLYYLNGSGACNPCMIGANSLQLDPTFTNSGADDFTLQAGSPAIDTGTPLGIDRNAAGPGEFNGSAPDIGAWESP